jgi:hypothetical protein
MKVKIKLQKARLEQLEPMEVVQRHRRLTPQHCTRNEPIEQIEIVKIIASE